MNESQDHVPIETLLRYRNWLRSLIRELAADPDIADEVEQATWEVAVRRPPRHHKGLGSWLAHVARSRLRDRYRREQRRERRETEAAGTRAHPSTEELVQRAELQRRVADAVLALREPYRATVLQRYFDDRTPAEIAEAAGVSIETVRTRLKRVRSMLRESLASGSDEGPRRWLLVALPWLGDAGSSAGRSAALGVGVVGMKKTVVGVIVALVLLGGGWMLVGDPLADDPVRMSDSSEPPKDTPQGPGDHHPELAGIEPMGTQPDAASNAGTAVRVVRLVVRSPRYVPLPQAQVRARLYEGYIGENDVPGARPITDEVRTSDESGRIKWSIRSSKAPATVAFDAIGEGLLSFLVVRHLPPGGPVPEVSLLVTELDHEVTGSVVDAATGRALPEARVFLWGYRTGGEVHVEADGVYALRVPGTRRTISLGARAPGYAAKRETVSISPMTGGSVEFRLLADVTASGQITTQAGQPVEGALVRVSSLPYRMTVRSDADGRYLQPGLSPKTSGTIMATHPKYGSAYAFYRLEDQPESQRSVVRDIVIPVGVDLEGIVLGSDDEPVVGARVTMGQTESAWNMRETWTDEAGRYRIVAAEEGPTKLIARAPGYALTVLQTRIDASSGAMPPLRLSSGEVLMGRVVDESGSGLPHVYVSARLPERRTSSLGGTYTSAEGKFRFDELPAGDIRLYVVGHGYQRTEFDTVGGTSGVQVVLRRALFISLRVVDEASGDPIPAYRIQVVGGAHYTGALLDGLNHRASDGTWDSGPVKRYPGNEELEETALVIRAQGCAPHLARIRADAGSDSNATTIRLSRGGVITGTVRGPDGEPIPRAEIGVAWTELDGVPGVRRDGKLRELAGSRSGPDGRFSVPLMPLGKVTLSVAAEGYRTATVKDIEIVEGRNHTHNVTLHRGAQIGGRVVDAEGKARPGVGLHLGSMAKRPEDPRSWRARTDPNGRFVFSGLEPGTYMVSLVEERQGMSSYSRTTLRVELDDGGAREVSFAAQGTARIQGLVTGVEHLPPDALVELAPISDRPGWPSRRDRAPLKEGAFEFAGVPAGTYRLRVTHTDPATLRQTGGVQVVQVQEGGSHDVRIKVTQTPR